MTKRKAQGKVSPGAADAEPQVGPELTEDGQLPVYFPCLAVEGMPTSDRRTIAPDSLTHRALPFSILAQYTNPGQQGGHAGAEIIGHMTDAWRKPGPEITSRQTGRPFPEGTFVWQGRGVVDPESHGGKLVRAGHLRGNSVDLSDVDYDEELAEDGNASVNISRGVIAATTLCPIPAFADAYVEVGDGEQVADTDDLTGLSDEEMKRRFNAAPQDEPERLGEYLAELFRRKGVEAVTAALTPSLRASAGLGGDYVALVLPPWRAAELGDECGPCLAAQASEDTDWVAEANGTFSPTVAKRKRAFARGLAMKGSKPDGSDAAYPIENQADLDKAVNMRGQGDAAKPAVVAHIRKAARKLGLKVPDSLAASASIALPPLALFSDPHLSQYTPITIGEPREDGRREIVGHIGTWTECHVGYSGTCQRMPHSRTDYARFATGAARCVDEEGTTRIAAVGHVSMSRDPATGGHAPDTLSEADTVAFYDNQCTSVADVAAGEDGHGVWIHGLTVPGLSEAEVDRLLSSPPSGDWRGYQGNLELCAILTVNTPGYVVPRARVASGEPVSLVAAGRVGTAAGHRVDAHADLRSVIREELAAAGLRSPQEAREDAGRGDTTVVPLADRKATALLAIRKAAALDEVTGPFEHRSTGVPVN